MRSIESRRLAVSDVSSPAPRARAGGRIALVAAFAALLYFPILAHHSLRVAWDPQEDFPSFYFAARAASSGEVSPYDVAGLIRLARAQGIEQRIFPFLYPPPTLALLLPLAALPYRSSSLVLMGLNQAALLFATWWICRRIIPSSARESTPFVLLALGYSLLFTPSVQTLDLGQTNLLVLACVAGAWVALREPRLDWLAGALLAVACLLKLYLVLVLAALLVRRRFRVAAFAAGALGAAALMALVAIPRSAWAEWLEQVAPSASYGRVPRGLDWIGLVHPANQSLAGFFARLFAPGAPLAAWPGLLVPLDWAAACSCTGAAAWALMRSRRRPNLELGAELSLALLTAYLIAPFSWNHHLAFLSGVSVLSLALAFDPEGELQLGSRSRAAIAAAALVLAWDLPLDLPLLTHGSWALLSSLKCLAVMSLWAFHLWRTATVSRPVGV